MCLFIPPRLSPLGITGSIHPGLTCIKVFYSLKSFRKISWPFSELTARSGRSFTAVKVFALAGLSMDCQVFKFVVSLPVSALFLILSMLLGSDVPAHETLFVECF